MPFLCAVYPKLSGNFLSRKVFTNKLKAARENFHN